MNRFVVLCSCFVACLGSRAWSAPASGSKAVAEPSGVLRVAAVQMRPGPDIEANAAKIIAYLSDCAARHVQIAAFPECALSDYQRETIEPLTEIQIGAAEEKVASACRRLHIAAIVGTPERRKGRLYNCAVVINDQGAIVARYDKMHLAGQDRQWACTPGAVLPPVFTIGGSRASVMICHDSRFPEICRLPVLAGARVMFYISFEAILEKESKMLPYRAQVQARAVENTIYVVHANAPANDIRSGSHGQSRIVAPDGNIIQEASQLQEELLVADLNMSEATAHNALPSEEGLLAEWWREAVKLVPIVE
jgi:omega-amidase